MTKKLILITIISLIIVSFFAKYTWAGVYCVDPGGGADYDDLQLALNAGETNNESDTFHIVQGTYNGNFVYSSNQGYSITLEGGWTSGCASRVMDPTNTVLNDTSMLDVLALQDDNGGNIQVDGFMIMGSSAKRGIYVYSAANPGNGGDITLTNNIISGCTLPAGDDGAGIYAYSYSYATSGGAITLTNNVVTGNTSTGNGGGVFVQSYGPTGSGAITLTGNTISENSATYYGGGGNISTGTGSGTGGAITLTGNTFLGNTTDTYGGAADIETYSNSGTAGAITLTNNIVAENNLANQYGGGFYVRSYSIGSGGPGTVTLLNNTIIGNHATWSGGGVLLKMENNIFNVYNNIIWGNTAPTSGGDIYLESSGTACGYNNMYNDLYGTWNCGPSGNIIGSDPKLSGSFHLKPGSPCIDAGETNVPTPPGLPATDFEGDARTLDGNKDGSIDVDIGADEYIQATSSSIVSSFIMLLLN